MTGPWAGRSAPMTISLNLLRLKNFCLHPQHQPQAWQNGKQNRNITLREAPADPNKRSFQRKAPAAHFQKKEGELLEVSQRIPIRSCPGHTLLTPGLGTQAGDVEEGNLDNYIHF